MVTAVDMAAGREGIIGFEGGLRFWCCDIEERDGEYRVRWEHGWRKSYTRDGDSICAGIICHRNGTETRVKGKRIVEFVPCGYDDPRAAGLPHGLTP